MRAKKAARNLSALCANRTPSNFVLMLEMPINAAMQLCSSMLRKVESHCFLHELLCFLHTARAHRGQTTALCRRYPRPRFFNGHVGVCKTRYVFL